VQVVAGRRTRGAGRRPAPHPAASLDEPRLANVVVERQRLVARHQIEAESSRCANVDVAGERLVGILGDLGQARQARLGFGEGSAASPLGQAVSHSTAWGRPPAMRAAVSARKSPVVPQRIANGSRVELAGSLWSATAATPHSVAAPGADRAVELLHAPRGPPGHVAGLRDRCKHATTPDRSRGGRQPARRGSRLGGCAGWPRTRSTLARRSDGSG
jgi:hypothetical protein